MSTDVLAVVELCDFSEPLGGKFTFMYVPFVFHMLPLRLHDFAYGILDTASLYRVIQNYCRGFRGL
jgi:hypothetical protein